MGKREGRGQVGEEDGRIEDEEMAPSEEERKCVNSGAEEVLPPEIIERILSRLPPACIFKLRSVCKRWNASLSAQPFLRTCIQEPLGLPLLFTFTDEWNRSVAVYHRRSNKWHKFPFNFVPHLTSVEATAGGLVLCMNLIAKRDGFVEDGYVVCNPATKAWIQLPQPSSSPFKSVLAMKLVHSRSESAAAFQVIRSTREPDPVAGVNGYFSVLEAYSSDTQMWTVVGRIRHCEVASMVWCHNSMYCLNTTRPHMLVSSRLETCQWRSFELPPVKDVSTCKLLEWKGNVLVAGISSSKDELRIWMLQPITFEWTRLGRGMDPYVLGTGSACTPISAVPCGDFLFFFGLVAGHNMKLLAFNIPRKKWNFVPSCPFVEHGREDTTFFTNPPCFWSCTPSLHSPF